MYSHLITSLDLTAVKQMCFLKCHIWLVMLLMDTVPPCLPMGIFIQEKSGIFCNCLCCDVSCFFGCLFVCLFVIIIFTVVCSSSICCYLFLFIDLLLFFARSQTGSGKTHTMMGSDRDPGIIPASARKIFQICCDQSQQAIVKMRFVVFFLLRWLL